MKQAGFVPLLIVLVPASCLWLLHSCSHEGIPADQMKQVCFTSHVLPVFQNSCATTGCHDAATAEDNYIFTDYANILKAITPGNASKSKAYRAITSHSEIMPPSNPLPMDKRILIRLWIEQGAKETTCEASASIKMPDYGIVSPQTDYQSNRETINQQHLASAPVSQKPAIQVH